MSLTNAFYEAVKSGNVRRVRIMMQDSLLVDPSFTEFNSMEKEAASMAGLYDEHDGKELIEDCSLWNDDYMDKVMVNVLSNFSHERLDHLKEVVRYLRPATEAITPKKEQTDSHNYSSTYQGSYEEEKHRHQECGGYSDTTIGVGAVVGATVGGVIASVSGATVAGVMGGVVAGAVIGGVVTTLIVNGGK